MGVKAKLGAYQLKVVGKTWYTQWRDNRVLRGCPVNLEVFKRSFLDRFFPIELREAKVEEFINLHQSRMSVLDYSLKFRNFSKYAPSLVSNLRDEISHFLTKMCNNMVEECRSTMLHDNMYIYFLMVLDQQVD